MINKIKVIQSEEKSAVKEGLNQVGELVLGGVGWWWQFRKVSQGNISEEVMSEQRR